MAWYSIIVRKLHWRIWLVVAGSVTVLSLILGIAWYLSEQARLSEPALCEVTIHDAAGGLIDSETEPVQFMPGGGLQFKATINENGRPVRAEVQVKPRIQNDLEDVWWGWLRPPYGFWWALVFTGLTVMVAVLPLARQLTRQLETLKSGVERWGRGDLSMRFPEMGCDEVADLGRHFNTAAGRLGAMIESQKSLLAHASHELRSPLARIRMAMDLAPRSQAARQRAYAEILHNLNELDELIENILLASRLEIRPPGLYEDVEQVDLIGLVAEECARTGATLNIAPNITANPAGAAIYGSLMLLRRAVRNLLENAANHGRRSDGTSETSVLLECEDAENPAVLIHVDDRGPGVPVNQRQYIFEPFYTLPAGNQRGFGLGLAMVRTIAQRHGGSVTYSDREGGGARFTLCLPRRSALSATQQS